MQDGDHSEDDTDNDALTGYTGDKSKVDKDGKKVWQISPDGDVEKITLPSWFPSAPRVADQAFKISILTVDVDAFYQLTYEQVVFLYRGLIRTAYIRAVQLSRFKVRALSNKKKAVFSLSCRNSCHSLLHGSVET